MSTQKTESKPFKSVLIFDAFDYLGVIYMKMTDTHAQHYRTGETFDFTKLAEKTVNIVPPSANPHTWVMELPPESEVVPDDTLLPGEREAEDTETQMELPPESEVIPDDTLLPGEQEAAQMELPPESEVIPKDTLLPGEKHSAKEAAAEPKSR